MRRIPPFGCDSAGMEAGFGGMRSELDATGDEPRSDMTSAG